MLIYVENFKIILSLRYFTCRWHSTGSIHPVNIFKIEVKLCNLEQNIETKEFKCFHCNKTLENSNYLDDGRPSGQMHSCKLCRWCLVNNQ